MKDKSTSDTLLRQWVSREYLSDTYRLRRHKQFVSATPTPHIILRNLLQKKQFVAVRVALRKQRLEHKEADLFSFAQTTDLLYCTDKTLRSFVALLRSRPFAQLIMDITGARITPGNIDAAGFLYSPTDYLLCHDDQLEGRVVAYVYNASTLAARQGGALCFLAANKQREPTKIVREYPPMENSLSLFLVTPTSHHLVEEVRAGERWSITGWFHG